VGYAAKNPQRVAALVLADTLQGLIEPPAVSALMTDARNATSALSQLERVLGTATRTENPPMASLYTQLASFNATDRRNLPGVFSPLIAPEALGKLGFATLFLVGQHDVLFPPAAVQKMQQQVPGSFYMEVSDCGHSAYFEQPQAFNDSLLSFLQAVHE
jgi:3-oxoadipate enol-lactonase